MLCKRKQRLLESWRARERHATTLSKRCFGERSCTPGCPGGGPGGVFICKEKHAAETLFQTRLACNRAILSRGNQPRVVRKRCEQSMQPINVTVKHQKTPIRDSSITSTCLLLTKQCSALPLSSARAILALVYAQVIARPPESKKEGLWACSPHFAHLAALGLVSMMMHYVIVKTVVLVGLIGMHKTGCSGGTCTYLAHHELESVLIFIIIIIVKN